MNLFAIVGTVKADPKTRRVESKGGGNGWDATEFIVEVKASRKGAYPKRVRVEVFGFGAAEAAEQVRAGMLVAAKGEADASGYAGKQDTSKIYGSLEMKNATVEILSRISEEDAGEPEDRPARAKAKEPTADDLPF